MPKAEEFVASLADVFARFGVIQVKAMFGGQGVYHDGLMFALVADDVLYLKADAQSAGAFTSRGLEAFAYEKGGRRVRMSYYAAPEEVFDDPDAAREWAARAYGAALRGAKSKKGSKGR